MSCTLPKNGLHIRIREGEKLHSEKSRSARKEDERVEIEQGQEDAFLFEKESRIPIDQD